MEQGNHKRVVILFERCLIACAHYEEFWCRYARYMELYAEKKAKGLVKDDEDLWISSKEHEKLRAESEENVKQIMSRARDLLNNVQGDGTDAITHDDAGNQSKVLQELSSRELPEAKIDGISSGLSALSKTPLEAIREVYRRACIVHCPKKPMVRLQWAAFEEEQGQVDFARQVSKCPLIGLGWDNYSSKARHSFFNALSYLGCSRYFLISYGRRRHSGHIQNERK